MPSEFAAGQREVGRVQRNLQARIFRLRRQLAVRQEDVAPHLAAERQVSGRSAGPVLRRLAGGAATHRVRSAGVDRAVAVDVPAVQHRLGDPVVPHLLAHVGKVVTEVEVDGVAAVDHVLRQLRVDKLPAASVLAVVVVNDGSREGVVEVPLDSARRGGSTASAASCSCWCSCW